MEPRLKSISKERYTWHNATSNVEVTPLRFFYPEDKDDIIEIIKDAEQKGLRVRAVGSGHSFSEATICKDYLLSMKKMDEVFRTPKSDLKEEFKEKHLVSIEAGIILMVLNKKLDAMGLALPNMGAVDFQTVSGALLTGTHGTGIKQPAFPDMVRSLKLVGTGGALIQIEPSDGMTDATTHSQQSSLKLIQDDKTFYSAILSLGAFGIIYEVTMEIKQTFWLQEKRYIKKWSKLKEELQSGEFMALVENTDFVAFRANPYKIKGDHTCAIVEQNIVREEDKPKGFMSLQRNLISTIFGDIEYLIESTIRQMNRKPQNAGKTIERALNATKDISYFAKSHKVLYQSGLAVIRHGISSEFAFDANAEKMVEVLERIFLQASINAKNGKLYQSSHIPVRFVPPSKAYLSSAYKRKTAYIDVPLLHNTIGDFEILERYQEMMIGLGGIPHWGKVNNKLYERNDFIKSKFKDWKIWSDLRKQLDPKGTFLNDFVVKMGLS